MFLLWIYSVKSYWPQIFEQDSLYTFFIKAMQFSKHLSEGTN